jgi:hypothetical protein
MLLTTVMQWLEIDLCRLGLRGLLQRCQTRRSAEAKTAEAK